MKECLGWGEANLLDYVHVVEKALKVKFRSLDWGAEGLEHLTLEGGQSAGLDLEGWKYVPHNIDNPTHAFALGSVAQKFVSMLLGRV